MLENFADGFAFIIGAMRALSDFLEDDVFDLGETLWVDCHCGAFEAPRLQDNLNKVVLLVDWRHCIAVSVVADESFLADVTILALLAHYLNEIVHYGFGALLARSHSRVGRCVVLRDEGLEGDCWGTLGELLPCLLNDGKAVRAHISLLTYERIESSASVSENYQMQTEIGSNFNFKRLARVCQMASCKMRNRSTVRK